MTVETWVNLRYLEEANRFKDKLQVRRRLHENSEELPWSQCIVASIQDRFDKHGRAYHSSCTIESMLMKVCNTEHHDEDLDVICHLDHSDFAKEQIGVQPLNTKDHTLFWFSKLVTKRTADLKWATVLKRRRGFEPRTSRSRVYAITHSATSPQQGPPLASIGFPSTHTLGAY